jgi:hypothetical protein
MYYETVAWIISQDKLYYVSREAGLEPQITEAIFQKTEKIRRGVQLSHLLSILAGVGRRESTCEEELVKIDIEEIREILGG